MGKYDFDLFTIGAGSGGVRASRMSASYGARVGVAEERYLGGTCVNVGCIPKKLFSYGAHYTHEFEDAAAYGWRMQRASLDWPTVMENKNKEIKRLNEVYWNILKKNNVKIYEDKAVLLDAHTLKIGGQTVTADKILIATGGHPIKPKFQGAEYAISSDEAFYLQEIPKRTLVAGGGYIAVEFASIFKGYGSDVTQLYRGDLFLRGFDDDVRAHLAKEFKKNGIKLCFNADVVSIKKIQDELLVEMSDGRIIKSDTVFFAIGRRPNTKNIGLEAVGVKMKPDGSICVNEYFETSKRNIYALGDIIDRYQLTPVAISEAMILSNNLFNGTNKKMNYDDIATAVFSEPNIATVGLTEAQARKTYSSVKIYRSEFRPLKHTVTGRDQQCLMKLIVDEETDRVAGIHMVGAEAGEIIQGFAVALKAGATKSHFDSTIGIHPTSAEEFVTMN